MAYRKNKLYQHYSYVPHLTPVQKKVLAEAAKGGTLREIAARLGQPRTYISGRLSDAYKNLGVNDLPRNDKRGAAIAVAREHGLIPGEGRT
jgi:DNA-binding NarL/FixJ family response regulator